MPNLFIFAVLPTIKVFKVGNTYWNRMYEILSCSFLLLLKHVTICFFCNYSRSIEVLKKSWGNPFCTLWCQINSTFAHSIWTFLRLNWCLGFSILVKDFLSAWVDVWNEVLGFLPFCHDNHFNFRNKNTYTKIVSSFTFQQTQVGCA